MHQYIRFFKGWRLSVISVVTFFALGTVASQAQEGGWNSERAGGVDITRAFGTLAQARNGKDLLDVWEGPDHSVMMAFNNGTPFTIGTTLTFDSPAVTAWASNAFMVAHVGTDSHIYYTFVVNNNNNNPPTGFFEWFQVPGQTTNNPVSLAQLGAGSDNVFMVYLSSNGDHKVWGTFYDGSGNWEDTTNIGGGLALTEPSITYSSKTERLVVVAEGLDNALWATVQPRFSPTWPSWTRLGGFTNFGPRVASDDIDNVLVSFLGSNLRANNYALFNSDLKQTKATFQDDGQFPTTNSVGLSTIQNEQFAPLLTDTDGNIHWNTLTF